MPIAPSLPPKAPLPKDEDSPEVLLRIDPDADVQHDVRDKALCQGAAMVPRTAAPSQKDTVASPLMNIGVALTPLNPITLWLCEPSGYSALDTDETQPAVSGGRADAVTTVAGHDTGVPVVGWYGDGYVRTVVPVSHWSPHT
jgi:hypothetical protein